MPHVQNLVSARRNTNITVLDKIFRIGPGGFIEDGEGNPLDIPDKYASRLLAAVREWQPLNWDPNDPKNARRFTTPEKASHAALGRPVRTRDDMAVDYGAKPLNGEEVAPNVVEKANEAGEVIEQKTFDAKAPEGEALDELAKADAQQEAESKGLMVDPKTGERLPDDPHTGVGYADSAPAFSDNTPPPPPPAGDTGLVPEAESPESDEPLTKLPLSPEDEAHLSVSLDVQEPEAEETISGPDGTEYIIPADGDWPEPEGAMPRPYLKRMADAYDVTYKPRTPTTKLVERIHGAMFPGAKE